MVVLHCDGYMEQLRITFIRLERIVDITPAMLVMCFADIPSAVDLPSFNFLLALAISVSDIGSSRTGTCLEPVNAKGTSSCITDFCWKCSPRASAEGYDMFVWDVESFQFILLHSSFEFLLLRIVFQL